MHCKKFSNKHYNKKGLIALSRVDNPYKNMQTYLKAWFRMERKIYIPQS